MTNDERMVCEIRYARGRTTGGEIVKEDLVAHVHFTEHPDAQIVEALEDAFTTSGRDGTGKRHVLLGLLIDLGTCPASIAAERAPAGRSQIFILAF